MVYVIFVCFAVPLALMLPFLKGQSRLLVSFMLLGAAIAVSAAEINAVLQALLDLPTMDMSLRVAPVTEEVMKAVPVLMFALLSSDDSKKVLPLSMAVGIGFAILENSYYLINNLEAVSLGWAFVRGVSASLLHGICTFLVGCGILYVRKQKELFFTGIFGLLTAAIALHATYNLLISSPWDKAGMLMPIVLYLITQCILSRAKIAVFLKRLRRSNNADHS